ncbi:MAG: PD-(D/E)XK nuclease family protein [Acidobacteria bacterium]|nr:PD-(D/E)XK nuclease family protein [Acidobacteriota bacterium]
METVGGGFGYESTLGFLCHSLSPEPEWERLSVASQWRPVGREAWLALGIEPLPQGWPEWPAAEAPAPRSHLAGMLQRVLPLVAGSDETAGQGSAELFAGWLQEALDELLEMMGDGPVTIREFSSEVIELLRLRRQPASTAERGIALRRPGMVIGGYFRHLFLPGMVEGEMPRSVSAGAVLDLYERKRLRAVGFPLATAVDLLRQEKLGFVLTIGAATESITLSLPRMKLGKPTIESGILARCGIAVDVLPAGHATSNPLSIEEARRSDPRREWPDDPPGQFFRAALAVERSRELSPDQDEYDGVTGQPVSAAERTWSASQLTRFGQCRFKWFSRHILGVEEESELPIEVTSRQYGRLFHRALELALEDLPAGADPRQWALSRIEDSLIAAEDDPSNPLFRFPAWEAQRTEWLDRLRRAIESDWFINPGAQVIGREEKFEEMWQGLKVTGSIDRIDRTPEGIEMVDYKTGSSFPRGANDGSGRLKLDLQLPIYIEAAGSGRFPGEKITGRYFSLTSRRNLVRRIEDQATGLANFTERLRRQLTAGDFAVEPDSAGEACSYCDYELICRRGRRLARKARLQSLESTGGEEE